MTANLYQKFLKAIFVLTFGSHIPERRNDLRTAFKFQITSLFLAGAVTSVLNSVITKGLFKILPSRVKVPPIGHTDLYRPPQKYKSNYYGRTILRKKLLLFFKACSLISYFQLLLSYHTHIITTNHYIQNLKVLTEFITGKRFLCYSNP